MFNINGIDTCTIVLIFTLKTFASTQRSTSEDFFNVGTVLFTSNDLNKIRWSRTNMELLQARRYFQNVIPIPSLHIFNKDYIENLLDYFTNAFSALKREDTEPELADVMERALADTVGGYFKIWVLPITKLAYYAGAISQDNAVKAFEFYGKLKRNLNTDGSGWRKPSNFILNSIAITVTPYPRVSYTRSIKDPCGCIAYYENTDTGLIIPMPIINWNETPYSIFLPLKNNSLTQLDSPSSAEEIIKYYDIAENCCHAKDPDTCSEFDLRFQDWLSNNVIPHMNDDKLYIAFGSLLSLMNKTNEFIKRTSNMCEYDYENYKYTLNSLLSRLPPWMTSNKFLILIFILIIEIIWCVPAMCYIICYKKKRKMKQRTKFFLDVFKRRKGDRCQTVGIIVNSEEKRNFTHQKEPENPNKSFQSQNLETGLKLHQKPRIRCEEVDTQCPSNTSKHSTGQVTSVFSDINNYKHDYHCPSVTHTLIDEKNTRDCVHLPHIQTAILPIYKDIKNTKQTESVVKVQKLETTITKIVRDTSESNSKSCDRSSNSNKTIIKRGSDKQEISRQDILCPCTRCLEEDHRIIKELKVAKLNDKTVKINSNLDTSQVRNVVDVPNKAKIPKLSRTNNIPKHNVAKVTIPKFPQVAIPKSNVPKCFVPKANVPKINVPKNIKVNKSKGLKLNSGEPLLEIRIDKPPAEITVDVVRTSRKHAKPSKIPRLTTGSSPREDKCAYVQGTIKKRAIDDNDVKRTAVKHNKLNVTL